MSREIVNYPCSSDCTTTDACLLRAGFPSQAGDYIIGSIYPTRGCCALIVWIYIRLYFISEVGSTLIRILQLAGFMMCSLSLS